jgi:hypothetical protein
MDSMANRNPFIIVYIIIIIIIVVVIVTIGSRDRAVDIRNG